MFIPPTPTSHFYPRSPCGERRVNEIPNQRKIDHFYPRSPCGERPFWFSVVLKAPEFLSTLSLRRATGKGSRRCVLSGISIHALLAESDRAPQPPQGKSSIFLSTLSLRRATQVSPDTSSTQCISIHALLAESDRNIAHGERQKDISIHALLAESDGTLRNTHKTSWYFYPRSPCGERPGQNLINGIGLIFLSTLSLRRATHLLII